MCEFGFGFFCLNLISHSNWVSHMHGHKDLFEHKLIVFGVVTFLVLIHVRIHSLSLLFYFIFFWSVKCTQFNIFKQQCVKPLLQWKMCHHGIVVYFSSDF